MMRVLLKREEQRSLNPNIFLWKIIFEQDKHTKLRDGWRDGRKFLVNCVSGNILGNNSKYLVQLQFWQLFLHLFTNELEALGPFLFFCFPGMGGVVLSCEHAHTHTHTLTYIHSYTYTYTHIHAHSHCHTNSYSHTYTHIYSHTHIHTHSHAHSHCYTSSHTHTYTHTLSHTHTILTLSQKFTHTYTYSHTLMHIHTFTHTHTHSCPCRKKWQHSAWRILPYKLFCS